MKRFQPLTFPLRRYVLKALSLVPVHPWQLLTAPSNPVMPGMWRDVDRDTAPLDAVHGTAFPYGFPLLCGLRLARRRNVPFLLTPFLHLGDPLDPHDRTRRQYTSPPLVWLLKQADRVFVQTPSEYELANRLGVPDSKLVLQGLGVEPGECTGGDRAAARAAWGVGERFVVGHLANNSVEKGTVDLVKCWDLTPPAPLSMHGEGGVQPAQVASSSPRTVASADHASLAAVRGEGIGHFTPLNTPLSMHGEGGRGGEVFRLIVAGPTMPNFLQFWQSFPHREAVVRLGVLTDSAKRDFFAGIDAFCLPSRTDSFGLVLLEAWANGRPVVAYRAGGPADLIRDGVDGFLVTCGDVAELRAKLLQLACNPELARKMGEAGRQRVATDFAWEPKLRLVRDTVVSLACR